MKYLDFSFRYPAENLACDEILSDLVEAGKYDGVLRFWESTQYFVVLGVSQIVRQEVYEQRCREDGVRVLRRCSAGGAVLQGPGCLNFSLILLREGYPELQTIRGSYCYILGTIIKALEPYGMRLEHRGVSDLAWEGRKVSGNAQKRRRRSILHHGTILYNFDLSLIGRYLREPSEQPAYRFGRKHDEFVTNISMSPVTLKKALAEAFGVAQTNHGMARDELRKVVTLAKEKYLSYAWTHRR